MFYLSLHISQKLSVDLTTKHFTVKTMNFVGTLSPLVLLVCASFTVTVTLCNEYYIIPTQDYPCSFNSCVTLSKFATDSYVAEPINITLFMYGGNHDLTQVLAVERIEAFAMQPVGDASSVGTNVICNTEHPAHLQLLQIEHILIDSITFIGCDGTLIRSVNNASIQASRFIDLSSSALAVFSSKMTLANTQFISNTRGSNQSDSRLINLLTSSNSLSATTTYTVGGAMLVNMCTIIINQCLFHENRANFGGAIYVQNHSSVTITNSTFTANQATNCNSGLCFGGCLFASRGSHVHIDKSTTFDNNTSDQYGGVAVLLDNSTLTVANSSIENSYAQAQGGAIAIFRECTLILENTRIENSQTDTDGGAILAEKRSSVEIGKNCLFLHNTALNNGGVAFIQQQSSLTMNNSTVINNTALSGGVLFVQDSANATIANSSVFSNRASQRGGVATLTNSSESTITGSTFYSNEAEQGGVVYVTDLGSMLTVSQSSFSCNTVNLNGGALHVQYGSRLAINESSFDSNFANREGGAIYALSIEVVEVYKTNFTANKGNIGGVMTVRDSSILYVRQSLFTNNVESDLGAVIYSDSNTTTHFADCDFRNNIANYGGVSHSTRNSTVKVINCTYVNNTANNDGATIYGRAQSVVIIINSSFISNTAINDAVVLVYDSSLFHLDNVVFVNNSAGHDGGAVYVYKSSLDVTNTLFSGNRAENAGGSVYSRSMTNISIDTCSFSTNKAQASGGAVHIQDNSIVLAKDTVFINNSANRGGTMLTYVNSTATVLDCTFANSTANQDGGVLSVYYNSTFIAHKSRFMLNTGDYGGVTNGFQDSLLEFLNCNFTNNMAEFEGIIRVRQNVVVSIMGCTFTENSAENGGVIFTHSSVISINSTHFTSNSATRKAGVILSNGNSTIEVISSLFSDNSADGDGGVMSLLNQTNAFFNNCTFTRSLALSNGGSIGIEYSSIEITKCTFSLSVAEKGGGITRAINSTITISDSSFNANSAGTNGGTIFAHTESTLVINGSDFFDNTADASGGVIWLEESTANIIGCRFGNNTALVYGGALSIISSEAFLGDSVLIQNSALHSGGAIFTRSSDISFIIALDETSAINISNNTASQGGGIAAYDGNLYVYAPTRFCQNLALDGNTAFVVLPQASGGAVYAYNTSILVESTMEFTNNKAILYGGAVYLEDSVFQDDNNTIGIIVSNYRTISFVSNYADESGGAIFVPDDECSYSRVLPCFFQDLTQTTLSFVDNVASSTANMSGDDLYGGLLDRCTVAGNNDTLLQSQGLSRFQNITDFTDFNTVYSQPVRVCACLNDKPDCNKKLLPVSVKQGNGFTVGPLVAVDQVGHPVTATVNSYFDDDAINSLLRANQMTQTVSESCSSLAYRVSFPIAPTRYDLMVYANGPCDNSTKSQFLIEIQVEKCTCPIGFKRDSRSTTCSCICDNDPTFSKYVQNCSIETESIIREDRFWITYFNNTSSSSQYLIYTPCPLDYCKPPNPGIHVNLNLPDGPNAQCANNRSGLLCSQCSSNESLSLSLGSTSCIRCPDKWFALVIGIVGAALIAGLGLVLFLLALNITVAVGTLNSVIFYANIVFANKSIHFRQLSLTFVPVFISWLNLEIGLDTCFYDEMDAYARAWLELAFPLYIMFLVILIILVSSCSSKFANLLGKRNPVATLATLMLLSYTKLFEVILASLSYATLNYPDGTSELRWLPDATVKYFEGKHIPLIVVAIGINVIGLAYTILLISWQWLVRFSRSKVCCCARNQKLNSFIEMYHSPHTPKHRYWTGLLLLIRVVIYLISSFSLSVDPRIGLLCTVIIISSLLAHKTIWMIKTYKNKVLNAMESFVYFNIIMFTLVTWYTFGDSQITTTKNTQLIQTISAYISVGTIVIMLLLIIAYHIYRYGSTRVYSFGQKLRNKISSRRRHDLDQKANQIFDDMDLSREYIPPQRSHMPLKSEVIMADCEEAPSDLDISPQQWDTDNTNSIAEYSSDSSGVASGTLQRAKTLPSKGNSFQQQNKKLLTFSYKGTSNESITAPLLEDNL